MSPSAEPTATCRVVLCRGCCCGTASKHPDVDHAQQAELLRHAPGVDLAVTGCLGNCERSNTVVVPSRAGRAAGGRVTWLGRVLDPELTRALTEWVAAGGPGLAEVPPALAALVQLPGRRLEAGQRAGAR